MQIITIELLNDNALDLLRQLEQLNILRLRTDAEHKEALPKRQWSGSISKETANKMLQFTDQSREEWERT